MALTPSMAGLSPAGLYRLSPVTMSVANSEFLLRVVTSVAVLAIHAAKSTGAGSKFANSVDAKDKAGSGDSGGKSGFRGASGSGGGSGGGAGASNNPAEPGPKDTLDRRQHAPPASAVEDHR